MRARLLVAVLLPLSALAACGGGEEPPTEPEEPDPRVTTVEVTPSSAELDAVGETRDFEATARDQDGNPMSGVSFSWSVAPDSVASVDGEGTVTAEAEGAATVEAEAGGVTGSADLSVDPELASLEVSPDSARLTAIGDTQDFGATAEDANGHPVSGVSVAWSVGDTAVARVDTAGRAVAETEGATRVVARAGGRADSARLAVDQEVASVTISPDSGSVVAGNLTDFGAGAADANGHPLPGVEVAWRVADGAVARVDSAGTVVGKDPGRTSVVAEAGPAADSAGLRVLRARASVSGVAHLPRGAIPGDLVAVLDHPGGAGDTSRVEADGSFSVGTARSSTADVHLAIDQRGGPPREVHPFLLPASLRGPGPHDVVLVPTEWTVRNGRYAGETGDVRLHQSIWQYACGDARGGIWGGGTLSSARDTLLVGPIVWERRFFPLRVGFDRQGSNVPITAADSTALWDDLDRLESVFGRDLFRPVVWRDSWTDAGGVVEEPGVVRVTVDTSIAAIARGGLGVQADVASIPSLIWETGLGGYRDGAGGFRSFRFQSFLGNAGDVTFGGSPRDGQPVIHEFTHVLGLDHTCSWESAVLIKCSDDQLDPDAVLLPTRPDVVHLEALEAVMREEHEHDTALSLVPSLIGLRVLARGRDAPLPRPSGGSSSSDAVVCQ